MLFTLLTEALITRGPSYCGDYQQGTYRLPRSQQDVQCMQVRKLAAVALPQALLSWRKAATMSALHRQQLSEAPSRIKLCSSARPLRR